MTGLPAAARLRRAADFAALKSAPGRLHTRHFALRWTPRSAGACRLGLAVSRKVSKLAVERNRIKRTIRESFRAERDALPALDILVIARASAAGDSNRGLREDLQVAWSRLQALKPPPASVTIDG
ncbi:MAG: ribonuclease P protein component [Rhodanobacteraceae bacterium]|nr:MAG: ribonuclease P protein component [Rhodanobacteraceae bacterium]